MQRRLKSKPLLSGLSHPLQLLLFFFVTIIIIFTSLSSIANGSIEEVQWEILTKRNFSSQIRTHPHILLLVTIPWSGESRSLMKDVAKLVAGNKEKLNNLRLMVVHKNTEKMLADILGASDELTMFYYHHSKRFKYQGRLNARTIMESFSYLASFQIEEVPLKSLHNKKELDSFLKSTDEAVFLLEFCGWSAHIMQNKDAESNENHPYAHNISENGDIFGEHITKDENVQFGEKENLKGSENGLLCDVENGSTGTSWLEVTSWGPENVSSAVHHERDYGGKYNCSMDIFKQFDSFFSNFTRVVREAFLPPEMFKFAHINDTSLLPLLGIEKPKNWMLLHWISGCPNCSHIFKEGDDLRNFMQMYHPLIVDLDGDQSTHDFAFPANQPSIILFVDRWSQSPKIREESKNALDVFRRFVHMNKFSEQKLKGHLGVNKASMQGTSQAMSKRLSDIHQPMDKISYGHKIIQFDDKTAVMIVNEGGGVALERKKDGKGNAAYDLLTRLLQQKDPLLKKTKISLIAKEAGFQLLSDDFEVKIVDSVVQKHDINIVDSVTQQHVVDHSGTERTAIFQLDAVASDSSLNPMDVDHTVHDHPYLSTTEDGQQTGNSAPQLHHGEQLKQETCRIRTMDIWKERECSIEKVGSSDNSASESSCGRRELPIGEDIVGKELFNYRDSNLDELNYRGDDQDIIHRLIAMPHQDDEMQTDDMDSGIAKEKSVLDIQFGGSYFVSDGGYRMLGALTGDTKLPSVVILDPVLHQHYVLFEAMNISYTSFANFVASFLKGDLSPHQHSELVLSGSRQTPRPPFVNLDFHEADAIPRVTADCFSELILGRVDSDGGNKHPCFKVDSHDYASKTDALVLFTQSWCGFCQRMELVVREVHRAIHGLTSMLKSQRMNGVLKTDNTKDISLNRLLSIFYMDCTLNDCSFYLKSLRKIDVYPMLVLFPAEKDAVPYEGDISVNEIFDFIAVYGSSSQNLMNEYRGILWASHARGSKHNNAIQDITSITIPDPVAGGIRSHEPSVDHSLDFDEKHHHVDSHYADSSHANIPHVVVGSILLATDKLANAFPFDNSSILIVRADPNSGFQGVILNKPLSWDVFRDLDKSLSGLKEAPLSYGGPVKALNMPLVSLTQKAMQGYSEVIDGLYFGDPIATIQSVDAIRSGNHSAANFWFFLGFSGWEWKQLFGELGSGDWSLSETPLEKSIWPKL